MPEDVDIRVGEPDAKPDSFAHKTGAREGNRPGSFEKTAGLKIEEGVGKGTAERSTGINADARNPIDPESPNLSPA